MKGRVTPVPDRIDVSSCLSQQNEGVCLAIKVQARASRNEIAGTLGSELKIKVTAPPVNSAANAAVIALLASTLGCPRSRLELLRGHSSTHKHVLIREMSLKEVSAKLASLA
jgi:uncharacterized protein